MSTIIWSTHLIQNINPLFGYIQVLLEQIFLSVHTKLFSLGKKKKPIILKVELYSESGSLFCSTSFDRKLYLNINHFLTTIEYLKNSILSPQAATHQSIIFIQDLIKSFSSKSILITKKWFPILTFINSSACFI